MFFFVSKYTGPMDGMGLEKKSEFGVFALCLFFLLLHFQQLLRHMQIQSSTSQNFPYDPSDEFAHIKKKHTPY